MVIAICLSAVVTGALPRRRRLSNETQLRPKRSAIRHRKLTFTELSAIKPNIRQSLRGKAAFDYKVVLLTKIESFKKTVAKAFKL